MGGGGAGNGKHTQTHTHTQCPLRYTGWIEPRAMIGSNLDTCKRGPPLIKILGYEHWEDAVRGEGSKQCETHTHTHTHTLHRDTQNG